MWNTTYRRNEQCEVVEATHDFGQQVTVVTNFETNMAQHKHGEIVIAEFEIDPAIGKYTTFLNNLDNEVNPSKN